MLFFIYTEILFGKFVKFDKASVLLSVKLEEAKSNKIEEIKQRRIREFSDSVNVQTNITDVRRRVAHGPVQVSLRCFPHSRHSIIKISFGEYCRVHEGAF